MLLCAHFIFVLPGAAAESGLRDTAAIPAVHTLGGAPCCLCSSLQNLALHEVSIDAAAKANQLQLIRHKTVSILLSTVAKSAIGPASQAVTKHNIT